MERHDESSVITILGKQFNTDLDVNVSFAGVDSSKFPHLTTFWKTKIFNGAHVLFDGQIHEFALQSCDRILVWE